MRVLITGAGGFVGSHLIAHLKAVTPDHEIHGTYQEETTDTTIYSYSIDLRDQQAVETLIQESKPDQIYHLAGQAFVPRSFEAPWETLENNILAELNIFLACIKASIAPRILIVTSAEIYGAVDKTPIDENTPFKPSSPYSVSKIGQDMLGLQYFLSHDLPIIRARPFNHIGPGQNPRFVAPAFASQIAKIEAGKQAPVIEVGDLTAKRDFTDVRDIVFAYRLLVERGVAGEAYNIASGNAISIQHLLDTLLSFANIEITVRVDPARLRPSAVPILEGDISKLQQATGWAPSHTIKSTLKDVLNDCRQRISAT